MHLKHISAETIKCNTLIEKKNEVIYKTLVKPTIEEVKISIDSNTTIKKGQSIVLSTKLKGNPRELFIFGFQWINKIFIEPNSQIPIIQGKITQDSNLSEGIASLYIDVADNKILRFFKSEDEYNNGNLLEIDELEDKDNIELLLGHPTNAENTLHKSLFANNSLEAIEGKLVVKNITIDNDNLNLIVENQGNLDVVLNVSSSIHNVPITNNISLIPKISGVYSNVICLNDKMLLTTNTYAAVYNRGGNYEWGFLDPIFVANKEFTEFKVINNPFPTKVIEEQNPTTAIIDYNGLFGIPDVNTEHAYIRTIDATPKYNNSNEFYCALFTSNSSDLLLFDSETNTWTNYDVFGPNNKSLGNGLLYIPNPSGPDGIGDYDLYTENTILFNGRPQSGSEPNPEDVPFNHLNIFGKNPVDIKHLSNGIHLLITTYKSNSFPIVCYSNDNLSSLKEFGPITNYDNNTDTDINPFNTQGSNPNLIDPGHEWVNIGHESNYNRKEFSTFSKICNSPNSSTDTLFVGFCQYVGKIDPNGSSNDRGNKNFFLKSQNDLNTNEVISWDDILLDHYEYSVAKATERFISDDGQIICVIVDYDLSNNIYGGMSYIINKATLFPNYQDSSLLFNISIDGGTTWKYSPQNWKKVINSFDGIKTLSSYVSFNAAPGISGNRQFMFVDYNQTEQIITIGVYCNIIGGDNYVMLTRSYDQGDTWSSPYPYPHLTLKQGETYLEPITKGNMISVNTIGANTTYYNLNSNVLQRTTPIRYSDSNNAFTSFCVYSNENISIGRFSGDLEYKLNPSQLYSPINPTNKPTSNSSVYQLTEDGNFATYYSSLFNNTNIKGQFTYETTNDKIINVFEPSKNLTNTKEVSFADTYFNAFFNGAYGAYGSSYASNYTFNRNYLLTNTKLYTTNGTFNTLTKLLLQYNEFIR